MKHKVVMKEPTMMVETKGAGFRLLFDDRTVLVHTPDSPFIYAGKGSQSISMNCGNFSIEDEIEELLPLIDWKLEASGPGFAKVRFSACGRYSLDAQFTIREGRLAVSLKREDVQDSGNQRGNRYRIVLPADAEEHVYGCGEQFSYFDLRGRKFPLWTSEQGVGRNKKTRITLEADLQGNAGGDYWWTFFPQPSFVSSAGYWCHADTSAYAVFDFSKPDRHSLYFWELPQNLVLSRQFSKENMAGLLEDMSAYFGRQPVLPDWTHDGVILGIQGGTDVCRQKLEKARAKGVPVAGIWAQDWEGINITSFGQRLRWDWVWNRERYPGLDSQIKAWRSQGIRFLCYANCYVGAGWTLFKEASLRGYLVKNQAGEDYLVDFGEFYAGIVDLTNPAAFSWFADRLVANIIDLGISGWMADFGEYLPSDAVLYDGTPALLAHNRWPSLWAQCNYEAVTRAGAWQEVTFFMRAGFTGSQKYCPLLWAGDQNVDWSNDDGLPSALRSALGAAMSGHGLHHSDIGGYTTLYGMKRTKELFMRWAEFAAFTPVMRTHEGNRPKDNWQFDSDDETLEHLARMTKIHRALKPYLQACEAENAMRGIPVMRPLFLGYPEDPAAWTIDSQYLLGQELMVAPVLEEGAVTRSVHFPAGTWVDFWTGEVAYSAEAPGNITVSAPMGTVPVFYRKGSETAEQLAEAVKANL